MKAGEEPEAAEAAEEGERPEATAPAAPKRLPGLWVICVLLALLGMFWISMTFFATPLGVAVYGGIALLHMGAAVGLWLRVNAVRLTVMVLLVACAAVSAIGWALGAKDNVAAAIPLVFSFGIMVYLWLRRAHFRTERDRKPGLWSWPGAAAACVVLALGVASVLLMTVDDARKSLPDLELQGEPVRDDENGFVVIQEMMNRFPIMDDEELNLATGGSAGHGRLEPEERSALAPQVVAKWEPCLRMLDEALSRPHFVASGPVGFLDAGEYDGDWSVYCRNLARLVLLSSDLAMHRGDAPAAMQAADKAVEFGVRVAGSRRSILAYLVGHAIMALGLEQVREVSASPGVSVDVLHGEIAGLPSPKRVKQALGESLKGELRYQEAMLRDLMDFPAALEASGQGSQHCLAKLNRKTPFLKLNMTLNLLGDYLLETLGGLDHYKQPPPQVQFDSIGGLIREVGLIHLLRNPIGDVLVTMQPDVLQGMSGVCFRLVADVELTRIMLALRCYHLEHGRLPESLDGLAPAYLEQVPPDPFTEQPFVYEPNADPPRVFSVGPDQKADEPGAEEHDDIVVELSFAAQ